MPSSSRSIARWIDFLQKKIKEEHPFARRKITHEKHADIVQELKFKFGNAIISETEFFDETTVEMRKQELKKALSFLKQMPEPGYEVLMDLTAVDYLEPIKRTKVVYWLHNPANFESVFESSSSPNVMKTFLLSADFGKEQIGMSVNFLICLEFILTDILI